MGDVLRLSTLILAIFLILPARAADETAFTAPPDKAQAHDLSHAKWEKLREDDGIRVYRWDVPDSPLFAFKGEAVVDAPIARVASVLIDSSRRKEWVPNLIECHIVRKISPRERIEYTAISTPPFTKDRDFVFRGRAEFIEKTRELVLHFTSVEDPAAPETNMVRGRVMDSTYRLRPVEGGKHTFVEYRVHIDPRGSVAKWMVNMVQKNIPFNTLEAIRRQVAKPDVVDHPEVKALFETSETKPSAEKPEVRPVVK